jgi:nucleotide-binding universal stress UspA family protein
MKTLNKIMVAVDFSDYSLPLVQYAANLAKDVGAELLLVNVLNQRDISMWEKISWEVPEFSVKKQIEEHTRDRKERLVTLAQEAGCTKLDVKAEHSVRQGVPYEELINEIKNKKPDLLLMATKGRSNLIDTIIGSCAQKMFRRSPVPLLSIRGSDR